MSNTNIMMQVFDVIRERREAHPDESYVASLHHKGLNKILEKVGEEATETILAAKDAGDGHTKDLINETADLWFHTLVMLDHVGESPQSVFDELARRFGTSGIEEKRSRKLEK